MLQGHETLRGVDTLIKVLLHSDCLPVESFLKKICKVTTPAMRSICQGTYTKFFSKIEEQRDAETASIAKGDLSRLLAICQ